MPSSSVVRACPCLYFSVRFRFSRSDCSLNFWCSCRFLRQVSLEYHFGHTDTSPPGPRTPDNNGPTQLQCACVCVCSVFKCACPLHPLSSSFIFRPSDVEDSSSVVFYNFYIAIAIGAQSLNQRHNIQSRDCHRSSSCFSRASAPALFVRGLSFPQKNTKHFPASEINNQCVILR